MRKLWLLIALAACGGKSKSDDTLGNGAGTGDPVAADACADVPAWGAERA